MKTICIITRHAIVNYGSFLQAYATQKIFEDYGFNTFILDYVRSDEEYHNVTELLLKKSKKWNGNFLLRCVYRMIQWPDHYICGKAFEKERIRYLNLSERITDGIKDADKIPAADIYCTGSDQVWGEIAQDDIDPMYFLSFAPHDAKKLAFSSSFGKDDYPKERIEKFNKLLQGYDYITVREDSAVKIVNMAGYEATQILDPTMIFGVDRWRKLLPPIHEKGYVLLYQLNANHQMDEYAKQFAEKVGLKLLRVSVEAHNCIRIGIFKLCLSPFEFLSYIANAEYMITDSFHGTAFAIMFNRQFVEVLPREKIARNLSILKQFGLENRIVSDVNNFGLISDSIDYSMINTKLAELQQKSKKMIKELFE